MHEDDHATEPILVFELTNDKAKSPTYAHLGDSGMDIASCETVTIMPRSYALIHTGVKAKIPDGYELQVRGRSGMQCKQGILCAFGTVDSGYRGEIGVALYNMNDEVYTVEPGDRIAQLVLAPVVTTPFIISGPIGADTLRGTDGFGSSGK